MTSTLPKIRIRSNGGTVHIKAGTLPRNKGSVIRIRNRTPTYRYGGGVGVPEHHRSLQSLRHVPGRNFCAFLGIKNGKFEKF